MVPVLSERGSLNAPRMISFGLLPQNLFEFQIFLHIELALSASVLVKSNSGNSKPKKVLGLATLGWFSESCW